MYSMNDPHVEVHDSCARPRELLSSTCTVVDSEPTSLLAKSLVTRGLKQDKVHGQGTARPAVT